VQVFKASFKCVPAYGLGLILKRSDAPLAKGTRGCIYFALPERVLKEVSKVAHLYNLVCGHSDSTLKSSIICMFEHSFVIVPKLRVTLSQRLELVQPVYFQRQRVGFVFT